MSEYRGRRESWGWFKQAGLCRHGDSPEGPLESNLQEVVAAGWSICGMRMAPEGLVAYVQLAICRKHCHRGREAAKIPQRNNSIFKYQDPGQHLLSLGARLAHLRIWPTIALSRPDGKKKWKHPQLDVFFASFFNWKGSFHSVSKDHNCSSSPARLLCC